MSAAVSNTADTGDLRLLCSALLCSALLCTVLLQQKSLRFCSVLIYYVLLCSTLLCSVNALGQQQAAVGEAIESRERESIRSYFSLYPFLVFFSSSLLPFTSTF